MEIRAYKDMQALHTFRVPWQALVYCAVDTAEDAHTALEYAKEHSLEVLVLGGGSNILPTHNWEGLVIHNAIAGREIVGVDEESITIRLGAGEVWHDLVEWATSHGYFGLENLALIPGSLGGAVVQNIGAYDVDIQRYVVSVEAINIETLEYETFTHQECEFAYRNSIFKANRGQWMITHATLTLPTQFTPELGYRALAEAFAGQEEPTARGVVDRVVDIRTSKLPNWQEVGTAGSFFANPRVSDEVVARIQERHGDVPVFHNYQSKEHTIPAGWLIEHAGLDPELCSRFLYHKHHLVVINPTTGTHETSGQEIGAFTRTVQDQVYRTFGIKLHPEVVVL